MKRVLGSSGVALLFLAGFSLVVLFQVRDRMQQREGRRRREHAPPAVAVPADVMFGPGAFPGITPLGPMGGGRSSWRRMLDSDGDGEIRLEEIDEMAASLKALDVDENGKLTEDELPANMSWRGGSPPFDAEAQFNPPPAAPEGEED